MNPETFIMVLQQRKQLLQFNTYRIAVLVYLLLFIILTLPYWGGGEVISPHRQLSELGITDNSRALKLENRKFNDFTHAFIPEISEHLNGSRSGWLTLWTNKNELGRPISQIGGFGSAYLPSWILAHITDNPWWFITILSLSTCFLAGIFILLFCREISLSPLAGLIAANTLATSPLFMYWLTFPMFPAIFCWSASILWAVTRLAKKPDLLGWSAASFSTYSLLMTGYPQPIIFNAYILIPYGLYIFYRKQQSEPTEAVCFFGLSLSALIIGAVLALPVYLDIANLSAESARVSPDISFFTAVLPKFSSFTDVLRFFVLSTTPELFGNPIDANYPFVYNALSVTPLIIFFSLIGLLTAYKQNWGWWLAIAIFCLITFIPPLYGLCVKYLGFNLSRSIPLGAIPLPLIIIVAHGADNLINRSIPKKLSKIVLVASAIVVAVIIIALCFGLSQAVTIRWDMVFIMLLMVGLFATQYKKTHPVLLIAALVLAMATISYPLMLHQNPTQIATISPLVEKVDASLPIDSRFAVIQNLPVLPPNLNAELGVASIHSYNSLSPKRYHTLIKELGGDLQTYGRWNGSISPDYNSTLFWMCNISLILSATKITHENLEYLGEKSGVHLHKVISHMGDSLQVTIQSNIDNDNLQLSDPRLLLSHVPIKHLDQGDSLEFEVMPTASSVLILSQKFQRNWQAQTLNRSIWLPAKTIVVNDVFQGVLLPQDTHRVRLEFKPYSRFSWIAHIFWLFLLTLLGLKEWQKSRHSTNKRISIQ